MDRSGSAAVTLEDALAHEQFVRSAARAVLGADDRVEDAVQESLLAALRSGPRAPGALRAWLGTVARRRAMDALRKDAADRRTRDAMPVRPPAPSPEDIAAREEVRRMLVEEVLALEPIYRDVVVLRFYEDRPPREIAARLVIPVATVHTRTRRAIERLRERLDARRGGRRAWAVPLASVAGITLLPVAATAIAWGTVAAAAAALLLVTGGVVLWANAGGSPAPARPPIAETTHDAPALAAMPRGTAPGNAMPVGSSGIVGYVTANGRPSPAHIEFRSVLAFDSDAWGTDRWWSLEQQAERAWLLVDRPPDAIADADGHGRFVVDSLATATYEVRASLPNGDSQFTWFTVGTEGALASLRLDVVTGPRSARVRVLDPDGKPARGRVFAWRETLKDTPGGTVPIALDAEGRFELRGLDPGVTHVNGAFEGRRGVDNVTLTGGTEEEVWRLKALQPAKPPKPPRGHIEGRVVAATDGAPVGDVMVRAVAEHRGETARADRQGRFTIDGAGTGEITVYVLDGGWMSVGLPDARQGKFNPLALVTDAEGRATVELKVTPAARVAGRVIDMDGHAVARATVELDVEDDENYEDRVHPPLTGEDRARVVTDSAGRFELATAVPGRHYKAEASGADIVAAESDVFVAPADVSVRVGAVSPGDWLEVTVVDEATGAAVSDASVDAVALRDNGYSQAIPARRTAADGTVVLSPLPAQRLGVRVWHVDSPRRSDEPLPIERPKMRVALPMALGISGSIVLPAEREMTFSKATIERVDGTFRDDNDHGHIDNSGSFHFGRLAPGRYRLRFWHDFDSPRLQAQVEADAGTKDLRVRLEPTAVEEEKSSATRWLFRIRDADGHVVPRAQVWWIQRHGDSGSGVDGSSTEDGAYSIRVTGGGSIDSVVQVTDLKDAEGKRLPLASAMTERLSLGPDGREIQLTVVPQRPIAGVVVDPSGRRITGALVTAVPVRDAVKGFRIQAVGTARTGADGAFVVGGTDEGEHTLSVAPPPHLLPASVVAKGGATGVRIELRATTDARIRVVDGAGNAVEGATLAVYPADSKGEVTNNYRDPAAAGMTDEKGFATLEGLDAQLPWHLRIDPPDRQSDVFPRVLAPWTPESGDIRLERGLAVRGRVLDLGGRPFADVSVTDSTSGCSATTDGDGRFVLRRIRAGQTKVSASLGLVHSEPVAVAAGADAGDIRMDRGVPLRIRVVDWPGIPRNRAWVAVQCWEVREDARPVARTSAQTEDGQWSIAAVPRDARYNVYVGPWPDGRFAHGRRLAGGETEQALTLTRGSTISGRLVGAEGAGVLGVQLLLAGNTFLSTDPSSDGRFEFVGVPEGTYRVHVWGAHFATLGGANGVAAGTTDLEIRVEPKK